MSLTSGVTAVIPTIPPRSTGKLGRALKSALRQTRSVDAISLAIDTRHEGAAVTRNRALAGVTTEWSAFLDDDDEWLPGHIDILLHAAERTGADVIYPWFDVPEGFDPFPQFEGQEFQRLALEVQNYIPVTVLARTELIRSTGGFQAIGPPDNPCDDHGAWKALLAGGAKFAHVNARTWLWHWHAGNTSGRGDRW